MSSRESDAPDPPSSRRYVLSASSTLSCHPAAGTREFSAARMASRIVVATSPSTLDPCDGDRSALALRKHVRANVLAAGPAGQRP